jgi:hypothetical protein
VARKTKGSASSGSPRRGRPPERKSDTPETPIAACERCAELERDLVAEWHHYAELKRDLYAVRAKVAEAERVLRKTRRPEKALAALGISASNAKPGRRGRSRQELDQIVGLYTNLRTTANGRYFRGEREDLSFRFAAAVLTARVRHRVASDAAVSAAMGKAAYDELCFTPDTEAPMSAGDALRNVAKYLGVSRRQAWEILAREAKRPPREGLSSLDVLGLPPRPR